MQGTVTAVPVVAVIIGMAVFVTEGEHSMQHAAADEKGNAPAAGAKQTSIIVLYDNYPHKEGLQTSWGFSCLVRGTAKTILFDTGGDGRLLMANMEGLGIDPKEIEAVVLSHIHLDHVGGLGRFLARSPNVTVYVPQSFPAGFKQSVTVAGAKRVEVAGPLEICERVRSTGELGSNPIEQSLVIQTDKGLIVITGCAHPGIVHTVDQAVKMTRGDVLLVMGGFHLAGSSKAELADIVSHLRKPNVHYLAPCHCTGDEAIAFFEKEFGPNFIRVGVGKTIHTEELK